MATDLIQRSQGRHAEIPRRYRAADLDPGPMTPFTKARINKTQEEFFHTFMALP